MLSGYNDYVLRRKNVGEKFVFFVQRWTEMLENRTLDMYQYNILNTYVACCEFYDVVDKTMSGLFTSRQNVDDCKAETLQIIKEDEILEKYNAALSKTLLRILGSRIEGKSRGDIQDDKNGSQYVGLNRIKYQLKTPIRQLRDNYLSYILNELKLQIDAANKVKIEKCIGSLVSQCISNGWSSKGLLYLESYFEGQGTDDEKWERFVNKLSVNTKDNYTIYYEIKISQRAGINTDDVRRTLASLGLESKKGTVILESLQDNPDLSSKISSESPYIVTQVHASDIYSAVLSAINKLNSRLSIATFYNTISPWIANRSQIIAHNNQDGTSASLSQTEIFKTYDYVDSRNSVFFDTNRIFNDESKERIASKLSAVFAYTNLSRSSLFQETKYISLWIALESVMNTGQYTDIISHVKCVLPEVLCIRYIYRIVRNFADDCARCRFESSEQLSIDMKSENKKELVAALIRIFRNEPQYQTLLTECNANSLLKYRCEKIHELLNSKDIIKNKFEHYTQKIRWHIQRLYRLRNEITHSAFKEDKSLVIYIEHLYTYLAQLMSEVVYYIEHKNVETVEEAYATIGDNYKTYLELMDSGNMQINDILPIGIIEL